MGIAVAKPYIIDEFDSDDEVEVHYEEALETLSDYMSSNQAVIFDKDINGLEPIYGNAKIQVNEDETIVKEGAIIYSENAVKGLEELLRLLDTHDVEGAQKVAYLLKMNEAFSSCASTIRSHEDDIPVSLPQSVGSCVSSTATSTWPTRTPKDDRLSYNSQQLNGGAGDLNDEEERKALVQLDVELSQFEADEQKVATEEPAFHSGIPRLKSLGQRSGGSAGNSSDVIRRTHSERRRSPSPSGKLKASGIPRYSWAHVVPSASSASSGESAAVDDQALDGSCLSSQTLESLPEISDRTHIDASRNIVDKPLAADNISKSFKSSESSHGPEFVDTGDTIGEAPECEISMSDFTGRVKMKKKHSGLPSSWTHVDDKQKVGKAQGPNEHVPGHSTSASSEMGTEEILACRTIGECGDPSEKKVLDLKRWYCISRPQYKTSCGISAVVSCWNYLFSTLGHGRLKPVTQEAAMKLLGFTSPFDKINFGPITGNLTLLRWFNDLNSHFRVGGKCFIMYKPLGKNQTVGMTDQLALTSLKKGLKDSNTAFIYHCYNHYFCPIGYEDTSQFCVDAYKGDTGESVDTWVLIADTSRKHPSIQCASWEQICSDLNCKRPNYFNIRKSWLGITQKDKIKNVNENLHCIMTFQKVTENLISSSTLVSSSSSSSSGTSASLSEARSSHIHHSVSSAVDTYRPELGNDNHAALEDDEILSKLYAPIMRLHQGCRNPPLRLRRPNSSPLWAFPSPKEEDEYHIIEHDENRNEDIEYHKRYKENIVEEEICEDSVFDDDSEF